jgi:hypothetical protein
MIVATPHKIPGTPDSVPDVVHVSYDAWRLQITLLFEGQRHPVYLTFESEGFRVLDEGQLLEYWEKEARAPGWLWRIESGGWFDQEAERGGFLMGEYARDGQNRPHEYLVLGVNDCVSVLSWKEPHVLLAGR